MAISTPICNFGWQAPDFELVDTAGIWHKRDALRGPNGLLLMFICNHCPYVKHVQKELVDLANDYMPKGVSFVAINSNNVEKYPDDSPENMKKVAERFGYPFEYLFDETQETARAYGAECTPDFFVFDSGLGCVYRGQLDDSRPGNGKPVTGADLRKALDSILNGESVPEDQVPSIGCNIKWK